MTSSSLNSTFHSEKTEELPVVNEELRQNLDTPFVLKGDEKTQRKLVKLINTIALSKTGKEVLETAAKAGYTLDMEFMMGANGGCSKESKKIVLNPISNDDELVGVLVHEARHAGQFERGEYDASDENRPRTETLKTQIMRTRAVEADAQATAAQAMCELMEAGDDMPLRAFCRAEHNKTIAKAIDRALYDPQAISNGQLRTAAFMAWYENTEVMELYDQYYQIDMMERRLDKGLDVNDTYATSQSPAKIVRDLCLNSDGSCYFSEDPAVLGTKHYAAVTRKKEVALQELMEIAPSKKKHIENEVPFKQPESSATMQKILLNKRLAGR